MAVYGSISSGPSETFIMTYRDMHAILRISIPFCESEVNLINDVCFLFEAHRIILRFYISVYESLVVYEFQSFQLQL